MQLISSAFYRITLVCINFYITIRNWGSSASQLGSILCPRLLELRSYETKTASNYNNGKLTWRNTINQDWLASS